MIQIEELQLYSVNKNVNKQIIIKLIVNPEDYTPELEDLLYESSQNKKTFACVLQEFQQEEPKQPTIWEKRVKLDYLMKQYCEKESLWFQTHLWSFYSKYWITSRTQLTEEQLDEEIKSYQAWLNYN